VKAVGGRKEKSFDFLLTKADKELIKERDKGLK